MCGFVGVINRGGEPVAPVILRSMTQRLFHRGPDSDGHFLDGAVGFGHRRLSILDLTPAGSQPMATESGSYVLLYNGEVYNFGELRVELQSLGHRFHSRTDSEVVLHALAQWGSDAVPRFNGMFAFALYDRARRQVLLGRDRYGIKPLYYAQRGATVLFGSEIKAFLEHPGYRVEPDLEGLVEYLTFQNFLTDRTLFAGTRLLPAGTLLRIPIDDEGPLKPETYWDFSFAEPDQPKDEQQYIEELDRLFEQSVNRQLLSDVEIGAYLSGGMDTGAITAVAARQLPYMRTFTVGFDLTSASGLELGFDERAPAERLSYLCRTEHYEMVVKAGDMERVLPSVMWHLEEPRVGQSYPNYFAAKLAGSLGRVVLSGAGGDELFGGYPWRYYRAIANDSFEHYVDNYFAFWQRLVPPEVLPRLLRPLGLGPESLATRDIFRGVFATHAAELTRPEDYINHSLYFEAKTFLHGLLVVEDKLSMAHSLETRLPFLDNDLVDFATKVPIRLKLRNIDQVVQLNENQPGPKARTYERQFSDGKMLLRQAMRRHIPLETLFRAKQGFSAPDASWFRGESIDYVRSRLVSGNSPLFEFLDRDTVRAMIEEHLSGRQNRRLLIWSLLCLDQWCEIFLLGSRPVR
ncbi:MAG TPA: asparagine synthase (glutamine-hydrolyzing) [Actinomycetota bacterium]|nr:asparagine synthase (glutamine-hydrolyzing) [Actinomycetota bacterium]